MGVPRLFRYLSERYPLVLRDLRPGDVAGLAGLSIPASVAAVQQLIESQQRRGGKGQGDRQQGADAGALVLEEPVDSHIGFDRLYLDFNGVIHHCSHGNGTQHAPRTARALVHDIFAYLERLVEVAKPSQLLFVAIDGVAPRAKMNQQRQRRYKAAAERQERVAELQRQARMRAELTRPSGDDAEGAKEANPLAEFDDVEVFDSNCITPGTEFMQQLSNALRFFIQKKVASDARWAKLRVVLSGAEVPGEGEHKISDFIRSERRSKNHNPALTHCIYGLDADLMMLALASHEPNFMILREQVIFRAAASSDRRSVNFQQTEQFQLLSIGLLRHYLMTEMLTSGEVQSQRTSFAGSSEAWFERKIDDFVFLCYLCGNDFLPSLPFLDIGDDALPQIFEAYRVCAGKWSSGFLTDAQQGSVNIDALADILRHLAASLESRRFAEMLEKSEFDFGDMAELEETISLPIFGAGQAAPQVAPVQAPLQAIPAAAPSPQLPPQSDTARQAATAGLKSLLGKGKEPAAKAGAAQGLKSVLGVTDYHIDPNFLKGASAPAKQAKGDLPLDIAELMKSLAVNDNSDGEDDNSKTLSERVEEPAQVPEEKVAIAELPEAPAKVAEAPVAPTSQPAGRGWEQSAPSSGTATPAPTPVPVAMPSRRVRATVTVQARQKLEFEFKKKYYLERVVRGMCPRPSKSQDAASTIDVADAILDACLCYLEGLVWTFNYYYHGHLSWRWFYRFHAAPFASDFLMLLFDKPGSGEKIAARLQEVFSPAESGKPLSPLCQLLAVLPPASANLLPAAHASLMLNENSPLWATFHPPKGQEKFEIIEDPSGREYKNIPIIPWVLERNLLSAVHKSLKQLPLTELEGERDKFGVAHVFSTGQGKQRPFKSPFAEDNALAQFISTDNVAVEFLRPLDPSETVERDIFKSFLQPNTLPRNNLPSLVPLMESLSCLGPQAIGSIVVAGPSRNDTLMMSIRSNDPLAASLKHKNEDSFQQFSRTFLGSRRVVYVDAPYSRRGVVTAVAGRDFTHVVAKRTGQVAAYPTGSVSPYKNVESPRDSEGRASSKFDIVANAVASDLRRRRGVDVGEVSALIHVRLEGSQFEVIAPAQCCILSETMVQRLDEVAGRSLAPPSYSPRIGEKVLCLNPEAFGIPGLISSVDQDSDESVVVVELARSPTFEEFGASIAARATSADKFLAGRDVARMLGLSNIALSRLTSSVPVISFSDDGVERRAEVGLGLKYAGREVYVPGYARRVRIRSDDGADRFAWEYSERALALLREFRVACRPIFEAVELNPSADEYRAQDVFADSDSSAAALEQCLQWLRVCPIADAPLMPVDCKTLPASAVREIEEAAIGFIVEHPLAHRQAVVDSQGAEDESAAAKKRRRKRRAGVQVATCKAGFYVSGESTESESLSDAVTNARRKTAVGDRVVYMRSSGIVPFGARGTVVSLFKGECELVLDEEFLSGSTLDGRLSTLRGARVPMSSLVNVTRSARAAAPANAKPVATPKQKKAAASSANPFDLLGDE